MFTSELIVDSLLRRPPMDKEDKIASTLRNPGVLFLLCVKFINYFSLFNFVVFFSLIFFFLFFFSS